MSDKIKPTAAIFNDLPTNPPDTEDRARQAAGELGSSLGAIPMDHEKNTIDIRIESRQVLCGDCGPFTSSRDTCPKCGGHAEPVPHPPTIERLRRASIFARWAIRRAAARRRKEVVRNAMRRQ
jgi:rRNA maturation protein Nop10